MEVIEIKVIEIEVIEGIEIKVIEIKVIEIEVIEILVNEIKVEIVEIKVIQSLQRSFKGLTNLKNGPINFIQEFTFSVTIFNSIFEPWKL